MHITANNKNVPDGDRVLSNQGVNWPIRYVPIQRERPAIDMAAPRTFTGYISESSTKITAQIEIAQENM